MVVVTNNHWIIILFYENFCFMYRLETLQFTWVKNRIFFRSKLNVQYFPSVKITIIFFFHNFDQTLLKNCVQTLKINNSKQAETPDLQFGRNKIILIMNFQKIKEISYIISRIRFKFGHWSDSSDFIILITNYQNSQKFPKTLSRIINPIILNLILNVNVGI